ncbi:MAG: cell division protein FtsQ [Dysgonamonadaceae bacterium]|jgi:cell division protein FtsQ|nr:cell division protein FtsQ [Dysgonamonadaceae bacterium]
MVKKIIHLLFAALLLVYIAFAVAFINPKAGGDRQCKGVEIEIAETREASYLNRTQIETLLAKANIKPAGRKMSEINTGAIEKTLKEYKLIKKVEVYKTTDGTVKIRPFQRIPILRVISERGNYYVDSEGQIMPVPSNYAACVPLATGLISNEYAKKQLYPFADFLRKNKFWNEQIEQIHVLPNLDIELTPRKGNHAIVLGKIENYKENLDKLELFYNKGLNKIGWNKYSRINLKYKNQVVCTKRE